MSSSLTSPSKIATGLDGLAPTDNQYLGKIGVIEKKGVMCCVALNECQKSKVKFKFIFRCLINFLQCTQHMFGKRNFIRNFVLSV